MENETNETKTTTESTEKKQGWLKSHLALCIICVVIIAAVVVGVYFVMQNQADTPEKVAEKYVTAMKEGNSDQIMQITDIKGAYAWDKCGKDASKFIEEYNKTSDDAVNSYKDELKSSLDSAMAMLKAFGGVNISLKNVETPVELSKGLYKVKANMEMEAFGMKQDKGTSLLVYNGKYIGEYSE